MTKAEQSRILRLAVAAYLMHGGKITQLPRGRYVAFRWKR
jgi:hypothetical protein